MSCIRHSSCDTVTVVFYLSIDFADNWPNPGRQVAVAYSRGRNRGSTAASPVKGKVVKFEEAKELRCTMYRDKGQKAAVFDSKLLKFTLREAKVPKFDSLVVTGIVDLKDYVVNDGKIPVRVQLQGDEGASKPFLQIRIRAVWVAVNHNVQSPELHTIVGSSPPLPSPVLPAPVPITPHERAKELVRPAEKPAFIAIAPVQPEAVSAAAATAVTVSSGESELEKLRLRLKQCENDNHVLQRQLKDQQLRFDCQHVLEIVCYQLRSADGEPRVSFGSPLQGKEGKAWPTDRLLSASVLFQFLLHSSVFEDHHVSYVLDMIARAIEHVVQMQSSDEEGLCYWLLNIITLATATRSRLQRLEDGITRTTVKSFVGRLKFIASRTFGMLLRSADARLRMLILPALMLRSLISCETCASRPWMVCEHAYDIGRLVDGLHAVRSLLHSYGDTDDVLGNELVVRIFRLTDNLILNSLLQHPKLCSTLNAISIKKRFAELCNKLGMSQSDHWLERSGEAMGVLLMDQSMLVDEQVRKEACPSLSLPQVFALVENFTPGPDDTPLSDKIRQKFVSQLAGHEHREVLVAVDVTETPLKLQKSPEALEAAEANASRQPTGNIAKMLAENHPNLSYFDARPVPKTMDILGAARRAEVNFITSA